MDSAAPGPNSCTHVCVTRDSKGTRLKVGKLGSEPILVQLPDEVLEDFLDAIFAVAHGMIEHAHLIVPDEPRAPHPSYNANLN